MNTQSAVDTNKTLSPSNSRVRTFRSKFFLLFFIMRGIKFLCVMQPPIKASRSSSTLKPPLTRLSSDPLSSKQSLSLTPSTGSSSNQISSPSPMHNKQPTPGSKPKLLPKRVVRQSKGLETGKSPSTLCRPMSPSRHSMATTSTAKSKNIEKTTLPSKLSNVSKPPIPDSRYDKRTLFSSKLDPLVLTSKLLPMSPRNKAAAKPPEPSKVSIPPPRTITNASRNGDAVILDSPPSKGTIKPRHIIKIKQELPNSIKVAKDAKDEKSTIDGKKSNLHVSFSNPVDELTVKKADGPTDKPEAVESTNKLWGSWNKKRLSFQVPTIHEDPDKSSSTPSMNSLADDGKRKEKHRSLAPQYLKSLISGSNESMSEASHVALRRSNSMSGCPAPSRPSGSSNLLTDPSSSSLTKKRLSPLLVGSPTLPKARLETEAGVERVNSLGSSGKWASRSRILSVDLTRRRTIHPAHPLFSFERPGSAGAASIRDEKPGSVKDEELGDIKKQRRATLPATKPTDCSIPGSTSNETTNVDGLARSDPIVSLPKGPLLRPLLGGQTLGRFDFEASTSTSILPRRVERNARLSSATALTKFTSSTCRLSKLGISESRDALTSTNPESKDDKRLHEYTQFCLDLRAILNDDDWSSFMNCKNWPFVKCLLTM